MDDSLPAAAFAPFDDDVEDAAGPSAGGLTIACVFKDATLGVAFMEGTTLRFAQVADTDYRAWRPALRSRRSRPARVPMK